ncbi:MAG: DUF4097 family beta strand repeat-containing protein [Bacteroidota bacterium]|jgi:hypothetical protein
MNSEETLNHLFTVLREEKVTTDIAEVTAWIHAAESSTVSKPKTKTHNLKIKITMSTLITATLIGASYFYVTTREIKPLHDQIDAPTASESPATTNLIDRIVQPPIQKEGMHHEKHTVQHRTVNRKMPLITEIDKETDKMPDSHISLSTAMFNSPEPTTYRAVNTRGGWIDSKNVLQIDTLFKGVKKLVFKGNYNKRIVITGSSRDDVFMRYVYESKVKGLYVSKGSNSCKVQYELTDSVLTIKTTRSGGFSIGMVISSYKDSALFEIPENLPVEIHTDYGDISVASLNKSTVQLNTDYGSIHATDVSGGVRLNSNYGDITLNNGSGAFDVHTDYGDVKAEGISAKDHCNISTDYGDVDLELLNPIQDFSLDAKTDYGKIKMKRKDIIIEGGDKIKTGNGPVNISIKTDYGNVKIR